METKARTVLDENKNPTSYVVPLDADGNLDTQMAKKGTIVKIHMWTWDLYKALLKIKEEEFVSYEELNGVIDADVQNEARNYLTSARNMAERKANRVFSAVVGKGLKRLTEEEIAATPSQAIKKIDRACTKASRRTGCIKDYDALSPQARLELNTGRSILAIMSAAARKDARERIEQQVRDTKGVVDVGRSIEALLEK